MGRRNESKTGQNGPIELGPKQEAAALALASGYTLSQTSAAANAGMTTIKTWLNQPEFAARVRELRAELTQRVMQRVASGMCVAIDTLEKLCTRGKSETTRLKAAEAMLTHGTALSEIEELKARMDALEARQSGRSR